MRIGHTAVPVVCDIIFLNIILRRVLGLVAEVVEYFLTDSVQALPKSHFLKILAFNFGGPPPFRSSSLLRFSTSLFWPSAKHTCCRVTRIVSFKGSESDPHLVHHMCSFVLSWLNSCCLHSIYVSLTYRHLFGTFWIDVIICRARSWCNIFAETSWLPDLLELSAKWMGSFLWHDNQAKYCVRQQQKNGSLCEISSSMLSRDPLSVSFMIAVVG